MAVAVGATQPPLCVDLEGSLLSGELLLESLLQLLKRNPLYLFRATFWLLRGKTCFRSQIAKQIELEPNALAYNRELLEWLRAQRQSGRTLWLCTAANERLATRVAAHLQLFDHVVAGDLVPTGPHEPLCALPSKRPAARAYIRALRPHQWAKNMLVLVPLLAAHRLTAAGGLVNGVLAVAAFSLGASSVYVINDLLDLPADRGHPRKSKRPFAAGDLSIRTGLIMAAALLGVAALIACLLPQRFIVVFATYYAVTIAYSLALKGRVIMDALILAGLYTLRVIAGAAAVTVPLSFWLLLFSVFLFLSLAFVKRFAELDSLRRQQRLHVAGRGYVVDDLPLLQSLGTAAGYLSVLVLALYINSPDIQALYHRPKVIWILCVLMLYWISRVWMKAQRGQMHDDPVVFALKDGASIGMALLAAFTVVAAT
ncbi:MAG TPA: UbiA family prenyltransferase [Steroidobacteraceae bacterium]|nr:UbiA family prenyltransferase [Steroidobacteraceae bacterium]